ncbi:unnamed protein product [Victoria cruziana]
MHVCVYISIKFSRRQQLQTGHMLPVFSSTVKSSVPEGRRTVLDCFGRVNCLKKPMASLMSLVRSVLPIMASDEREIFNTFLHQQLEAVVRATNKSQKIQKGLSPSAARSHLHLLPC